jgi:hypothetical protein
MKHLSSLLFAFVLLLIFSVNNTPAKAQDLLPTEACGLGSYWLVEGGGWYSVWLRQGDSNNFDGRGAFWMQADVSSTLKISLSGDAVSISQVDAPNVWGTLTCEYQGTVRPDGVSVVGNITCEQTLGTSRALSWSAQIICDDPVVTWSDTAFWHRAAKGSQFTFECPPNGVEAPIWGTGVYIEGSSICTAGVHSGVISLDDGGLVTIEILPGENSYEGSSANGITSQTFPTAGQFNASFRVVGGEALDNPATPTGRPEPTPVLGTGEVQITLTWDNGADMDLSVTEPNGESISYSSRGSSTGGQLDVDSNYPCGENQFSVENIFWPTNGAPSGSYQVGVNQYSTCSGGDANWTLTVRVNGQVVLTESGTGGTTSFSFDA